MSRLGTHQNNKAWRRFLAHRAACAGLFFLILITLLVVLLPALSSQDPDLQDLALGAQSPSTAHLFGTDYEGRDLLLRVFDGGRISLLVGFVATLISVLVGVFWGLLAGYFGGRVDQIMMRIVDVLYGLPYMFFVIILMVWFGRSLINVFIGLGLVSWLTMARIVRGSVLSLKQKDFVLAARLAGLSNTKIILNHILPNVAAPIIVYGMLTLPRVMIEEAFLSFLGLGVQPPKASWGTLLAEGSTLFREYPWLLFFPALFLSLTLLSLNFVGDGLRDVFDPKEEDRS